MRRRLRRPTYADVVATLALFIALGGVSYAAVQIPKSSVGAKQLKKNAVTAKKIRKNAVNSRKVKDGSLLARDFKPGQLPAGATGPTGPAGPDGSPGETGPTGLTGETGPAGPSGTAVVMGRSGPLGMATRYMSPSGSGALALSVAEVAMRSPSIPVEISNLQVWLSSAPGPGNSRRLDVLANGVMVAGCTVASVAVSCLDDTEATIPPGAELAIRATADDGSFGGGGGGTALNPADVQFGYTLAP